MGRFGSSDDPWFRVGTVDVNTTIFVVGVGVLSMFVWAIEGPSHPLLSRLWFSSEKVLSGQVWRLLTWPIGIISVVLFGVLFYQIQLYSDTLEQFYYLGASVYGWWFWEKDQLLLYTLEDSGYKITEKSVLLPNLDLLLFVSCINLPNHRQALKQFRQEINK